ncbi:MAG TPA: LacI family DNA-binding transcriptional regulator [Nakamurella sp.]|nr:LacI family DNA-binding transcriptional regulator [Nakamurella sp.]
MSSPTRPTLGQVAQLAGVSVASVSRVLNDLPASAEMAARVRAAVDELGYVPDAMARSLKVRRTEQLALVVADVGNPVYVTMMHAVAAAVRTSGYRLVLSTDQSDPDEEMRILQGLSHGYADGLILSPLRVTDALLTELRQPRLPTVVIGTVPDDLPVDNVRADSARGIGLAVKHLIATGRRSIGFINGPLDTVPGAARQRGFDRAARRLGLDRDECPRIAAQDFTFAAGRLAARELLSAHRPDALVCANDLLAVGVIHELDSMGLKVPQDMAVAGMDDTDLAEMVFPGLTSVSLGSADRGTIAATLLLERIKDPARAPRRVTVAPHLVVRGSTAAPLRVVRDD